MRNIFDGLKFHIACKVWRNMNGLTIRDMAELSSVAVSTYGFIETGDRPPTMAEFSHLCALMGFEAVFFFKTAERAKNG